MSKDKPTDIRSFFDLKSHYEKDNSADAEYQSVRLSKARSSLYLDMPFFGFILTNLEIYPVKNDIPTFACDSRRIYFSASYLEKLPKPRLKGILMHLVVHLIMKHGERSDRKNADLWGIASDVTSHLIVEESHRGLLRPNRLKQIDSLNQGWSIDDTSRIPANLHSQKVEEVYQVLYEYAESLLGINDPAVIEAQLLGKRVDPTSASDKKITWRSNLDLKILEEILDYSGIEDPCYFGKVIEEFQNGMSGEHRKLEDNRMKGILKNGLSKTKKHGYLPSSIKEYLDELLNPKIPWHVVLSQFIQKSVMSDWNWVPPNRKLLSFDLHMPSIVKEHLNVIVAVDTSGSISSEELSAFTTETYAIITSLTSVRMVIIDCDAKVQNVLTIENGMSIDGSPLPWEGKAWLGRGGTSFVPVFEWVDVNGENPDLLIYFTDGYGTFPNDEPHYPVVWLMTTDVQTPFGHVIEYENTDIL